MARTDTFDLNWGSDLRAAFQIPDGSGVDGAWADLTGMDVDLIDVSPELTGLIAVTVTNAATGACRFDLDWADTIPRGRRTHFRLRLTDSGGLDNTSNLLWVNVS